MVAVKQVFNCCSTRIKVIPLGSGLFAVIFEKVIVIVIVIVIIAPYGV